MNMINSLADTSAKVVLVKSKFTFWEKLKLKNCTFEATHGVLNVQGAIVDISAMEMQFINRDIPTLVLFKESNIKNLIIPTRVKNLYNIHNSLENLDVNHLDFVGRWEEVCINKDYLFSFYKQDLKQLAFKQRIRWLCKFASDNKVQQYKSLFNSY
ncbi:hypothetical protein GIX10_09545 [Acinetobacter sp. YIM 103518]|uniref:Uncharacterized protein n=1 Tax=Acinetobacter faecalis TaxID=2665161 RepID=A0A6L6GGP9_9GAMM|nr:hypothetical protein [Acinetobacter faecalis]MTD11667.1 hypothetical protein [Acinetobacter faecalis]